MKTIMITGANSQIGSFLARQYEAEGRDLVLLYHKNDHRIAKLKSRKLAIDLRDLKALEKLVSKLKIEIDCLIHCSAVRSEDAQALAETDPLQFKQVFDENFYPAYNVLRAILPQMMDRHFGRVILFSSEVTRSGLPHGSAYAASKAAIANMCKSAALECASANVLINTIAPAPVDTALEEDFSGPYLIFRKAYFADHIAGSASKQLVSIAEIKQLADLLISEEIRSLCGEEIFLTGGKL